MADVVGKLADETVAVFVVAEWTRGTGVEILSKLQSGDSAVCVAGHALPRADRGVGQPAVIVAPLLAVCEVIELVEGGAVVFVVAFRTFWPKWPWPRKGNLEEGDNSEDLQRGHLF